MSKFKESQYERQIPLMIQMCSVEILEMAILWVNLVRLFLKME